MTDAMEPRPPARKARRRIGQRGSDLLNLGLYLGVSVLLLTWIADAHAGVWARATAGVLCAVAVFGAWQMVRRRFFPGLMPERWVPERLRWLRAVHATVLVAGTVVFLGYGIGSFLAPGRFSRTVSWLVVVGYFVVISMLSDFLKDREQGAGTRPTAE
jgi:hypothetical protein